MWKKPSIEMPDFNKSNLEELLEKESLDTNGGASANSSNINLDSISTITRTPGYVSDPPFDFNQN
ncbi:hypothetical protein IAI10_12885 [Clostridium sp. 19966]|uniref:hypothetical protein n=1 Tax=Clostridium sp. 19966 TaxID=2768166 RepID=UPI0028DDA479|nr:hypothetical protein [Clostridium sp. 19966]MDT8717560.1 hypothetical protein [Clostridium sp. 19966]